MFKFTSTTKQRLTANCRKLCIVTLIICGTIEIVATPDLAIAADNVRIQSDRSSVPTNLIAGESGKSIVNTSGGAEIGLATHLRKKGFKMYGAFWCGHCAHQKELFGQQAFAKIQYIECDPKGKNAQPQQCSQAGIKGFPTWQLPNGKLVPGQAALSALAKASGYTGPTNFKN